MYIKFLFWIKILFLFFRFRVIDDDTFLPIPNLIDIKDKKIKNFDEDFDESDEEFNLKIKKNIGKFKKDSFITIGDESYECKNNEGKNEYNGNKAKNITSFKIKEESSAEEDILFKKSRPVNLNNLSLKTSKQKIEINEKIKDSSPPRRRTKKNTDYSSKSDYKNNNFLPQKRKNEKNADDLSPKRRNERNTNRTSESCIYKKNKDSSPPRRKHQKIENNLDLKQKKEKKRR